ncbi:MAG: ROK family transcriptional regulator [Lentisphaeraceae bacterium]|nr:ROK family transcriptional regulator [Lentisphaeraceae bacterium]
MKSMNQQSAAIYNRLQILRLLRTHRQLSRTLLAKKTQLQNSTMSYIIRDFINRGIVIEAGKIEDGIGNKKQTLLQVNPALGWVIGIVIQNVYAELVKVDYSGKIIDSCSFEVDEDITKLPQNLKQRLERWFEERGCPPGPMQGICLGLPAVVDSKSGIIKSSSFFNIKDYPIAEELENLFPGSKIIIDNDVRQAALSEYLHESNMSENFLFFYTNYKKVSNGIKAGTFGSALFVDGQMLGGSNAAAGELTGILKPHDPPFLSFEDWEELKNPDGELTPTLLNLGLWILPWLEALATYSDPECIVMGGAICWKNNKLFEMLNQHLGNRLQNFGKKPIKIKPAHSPVQGVAYGAASTLLEHLSHDIQTQN